MTRRGVFRTIVGALIAAPVARGLAAETLSVHHLMPSCTARIESVHGPILYDRATGPIDLPRVPAAFDPR